MENRLQHKKKNWEKPELKILDFNQTQTGAVTAQPSEGDNYEYVPS